MHKSTVSREFKRNTRWNGYTPGQAQWFSDERRTKAKKHLKFTPAIESFIKEKLQLDWSPEQVSGYAKRHGIPCVSHERIYQFILEDKKQGGYLYLRLRHRLKKYRKRYGSAPHTIIKNRRSIEERPAIVNDKGRIGDWEIDTIIGKNRKQAIVTMVERFSKKTMISKVLRKTSNEVSQAIISSLKSLENFVLTITSDNGSEFAAHEEISYRLNADFYFARPYASWERGLNENTNGLIRQYLKKGCDFVFVTENELSSIMDKLNSRPRKCLLFATPNEVFSSGVT